jgi:hypothetical protein
MHKRAKPVCTITALALREKGSCSTLARTPFSNRAPIVQSVHSRPALLAHHHQGNLMKQPDKPHTVNVDSPAVRMACAWLDSADAFAAATAFLRFALDLTLIGRGLFLRWWRVLTRVLTVFRHLLRHGGLALDGTAMLTAPRWNRSHAGCAHDAAGAFPHGTCCPISSSALRQIGVSLRWSNRLDEA